MRIAFVGGKGGTGKSTVCYLVGLALAQAGKIVGVEDLDPQQSLSGWIDRERDGMHLGIEGEITLIDTRPALDDRSVTGAIEGADVIILPCSPSPADIGTARATADAIVAHRKRGAKVILVINRARSHTVLGDNARDVLGGLGLPIASTVIPERQSIQRAILGGWRELDADSKGIFLNLAIELITA
jgi:chromosome partitioning protein